MTMSTLSALEAPTPSDPEATATHAEPGFLSWVAALVHQHRARLLAYARRDGLEGEEALDAVQDCFVSFLKLPVARSVARDGSDAIKLLTVLLRHDIQNRLRLRTRRRKAQLTLMQEQTEQQSDTSEELLARYEELARVHGCILRMAELQRRVIMLSLVDQAPHEDIAEVLGVSAGYVRVLLHRAREHVRTCPFEYDDGSKEEA
jgi:RNA polymerase sigma-70 factor, ECF subfamily